MSDPIPSAETGRRGEAVPASSAARNEARRPYPVAGDHLVLRVLWLYGLYMLVSNACFLLGYYLLPEGSLRNGPQVVLGVVAADAGSPAGELAWTLLFNLGIVVPVAVFLNLTRVKGFPLGYVYPVTLGVLSGVIPGTNSFVSSDLARYSVREGMALSLSIGNTEMLGYLCVIAATVGLGMREYRSWWRSGAAWKPTKLRTARELRLSAGESMLALAGIGLVVIASIRETLMAQGHP